MTDTLLKQPGAMNSDMADLEYVVREPKVASGKSKAIILLHGVGSNELDLFGLADQLPLDFYIISARGQFTLSAGRYAWYNVDFSTGKPVYNKEQEASSRQVIISFIEKVKAKYKLDQIYLGGFSQGAIMSYSVGITHPGIVNGIIALSGRLLEEVRPYVKNHEYLQVTRVFIAHGINDPTLPVFYARDAKTYLQTLSVPVSYHEYNIGHQINQEIMSDLHAWLKEAS